MSSKWCPYRPLNLHDMALKDHTKPSQWTIKKLIAMSKESKKGANRLGVKCEPRIKCVPIQNCIIPEPHIGLGINNSTLEAYEDAVNSTIVPMSPQEQKMRDDLLQIDIAISEMRKKLKIFNESSSGK